jgi:carboxymethylenebutenolidase
MGDMIGIHQQAGVVSAYVAKPPEAVPCRGAIMVLHDIWGLTDHIKGVADRFAAIGYYSIAPDMLYTTDEKRKMAEVVMHALASPRHEERELATKGLRTLLASTQTPQFTSLTLSRLEACFEYVYNQPLIHQKIAAVGFGFGGTYTYALAVRDSRLRGAIPFYGHAGYHELELRHIACPVLAFYGGKDMVTNELIRLAPRMMRAGIRFTPVIYDDAGPSFFNDSNYATYNEHAASDAWHRMTSFLRTSFLG